MFRRSTETNDEAYAQPQCNGVTDPFGLPGQRTPAPLREGEHGDPTDLVLSHPRWRGPPASNAQLLME